LNSFLPNFWQVIVLDRNCTMQAICIFPSDKAFQHFFTRFLFFTPQLHKQVVFRVQEPNICNHLASKQIKQGETVGIFWSQQHAKAAVAALCVDTDQTRGVDRSDRSPGDSGGRPPNVARAGSRRGDAHRVALGSTRPPRTSSDVVETKEEQQVLDWKSWEEVKINTRQ
jgi:hypothetical protein